MSQNNYVSNQIYSTDMEAWACDRCNEIHTQNPDQCRNCGYDIFRPISEAELRERTTGGEQPESVSVETVGSAGNPDFRGSPDVNPDGSIKQSGPEQNGEDRNQGLFQRILGFFR